MIIIGRHKVNEIRAKEKSIRDLLQNTHFTVDYYQREYKWQPKQVTELIDDLTEKFFEFYNENDERSKVNDYGTYFLGSIIVCEKNGNKYIIDGQQRLTTVTIILIFLKNLIEDNDQKAKLSSLIFSDVYGHKAFNINVEERNECMNKLLIDEIDYNGVSESIENIFQRYAEIKQSPNLNGLDERALIFFSDWLIQNVYLVEITSYSDNDAYAIFETMNDRGLSLTPLDMLKGYLLTRIEDTMKRNNATKVWKEWSEKLRKLGKDEDSEAVKAWLRSQYAKSTRERKQGATPKDFEKIGTEFHRWVKDNEDKLYLHNSSDFYNFINVNMQFYLGEYIHIKSASQKLINGLEPIFYNAALNFTLQNPLLLAPLVPSDEKEIIDRKLHLTSTYLDILLARRIWNFKSISYDIMRYLVFNIIKEIRNKPLDELQSILIQKLDEESLSFDNVFYLHQMNRFYVRYILARIIDFIEVSSDMPSKFSEYMSKGKTRYEVEHIWANHPEWYLDEFSTASEFLQYRNRIGGLLLLQKQFNASYGDLRYKEKLPHYFGQNLLAKSLHHDCYAHNPSFIRFMEKYKLPFKEHITFKKQDLDERQELYKKLAEVVWSPKRLEQ